jgi:hypothetical protein
MKFRALPSALLILTLCTSVFAQSAKHATILRVENRPTIDGSIDPDEWAQARAIDNFHQAQPVEFAEPSQKTVWYIAYDSDALYVAAYAYDTEPDKIVAQSLRQGGSINSDDSVSIMIDAFNNKRSGYKFSMNPNGVRQDAIYSSPTRDSDDWEGIWRGAARIVEDGWTMEMAIPFKTLSFSPDNHTWGVNFEREISRLDEEIAWSSRNGQVNPTVSGEVMGFTDLSQGVGLDIIPSVSSSSFRDHALNNSDSETNPSLDINYKLTSAINWLVTFNTDFAATEADSRQLDIGRFSLFFPEKRSFFLTDFDIFQFGGISGGGGGGGGNDGLIGTKSETNGMPFFSRRIGLGPNNEAVDIIAGSKLSGRMGGTDFGLLYVRQDEVLSEDPLEEDIDASDLVVARMAHGVFEESSIGAIVTSGDPTSNDTSSLIGLDFNYRNTRLKNNRSIEAQFWAQKTDNADLDGDDWAYSAAFGLPASEGWEAGLQIHEAQENFDPRLGFANRTGVRLYSGEVTHRWINQDSWFFERVHSGIEFQRWEYLDTGQLQSQQIEARVLSVNTGTGDFFRIGMEANKERILDGERSPLARLGIDIGPGEYSFNRPVFFFRTGSHRKVSARLRYDSGDYYDGKRLLIRPSVAWVPNKHLSFNLEYGYTKYEFDTGEATTRQVTFENTIAFNSNWSLLTLAQYDNLSEDIGINMRLRYNRAAGQDLWLVLNHNMRELDPDEGFRSTETIAAVKVRYTFRF